MGWWSWNEYLFMFGGRGLDYFSDVWRLDKNSLKWTWWAGNSASDNNGVYGTQGIGSTSNTPGARYSMAVWTLNDDVYILGGYGIANSSYGYLSDLWRFEMSSLKWTWLMGPSSLNHYGVYGTLGNGSFSNYPGSRFEMAVWNWNGSVYIIGGSGQAVSSYFYYNDVWKFAAESTNITENLPPPSNNESLKGQYVVYLSIGILCFLSMVLMKCIGCPFLLAVDILSSMLDFCSDVSYVVLSPMKTQWYLLPFSLMLLLPSLHVLYQVKWLELISDICPKFISDRLKIEVIGNLNELLFAVLLCICYGLIIVVRLLFIFIATALLSATKLLCLKPVYDLFRKKICNEKFGADIEVMWKKDGTPFFLAGLFYKSAVFELFFELGPQFTLQAVNNFQCGLWGTPVSLISSGLSLYNVVVNYWNYLVGGLLLQNPEHAFGLFQNSATGLFHDVLKKCGFTVYNTAENEEIVLKQKESDSKDNGNHHLDRENERNNPSVNHESQELQERKLSERDFLKGNESESKEDHSNNHFESERQKNNSSVNLDQF